MAENTTVNKVVINNETVIDITDTTATPDTVAEGQVSIKQVARERLAVDHLLLVLKAIMKLIIGREMLI